MLPGLNPIPDIPDADPIKRFILLVLWQAHTDGATELVFGVPPQGGPDTPLRYHVDGHWYDLSPFPSAIRLGIITELERMARLSPDVRTGILDEIVGGTRLKWRLQLRTAQNECWLTLYEP